MSDQTINQLLIFADEVEILLEDEELLNEVCEDV